MGNGWSRCVLSTIKNYLYIVDYYSKFPLIKKMKDLSANSVILASKIIFRVWITTENNVRFRW